MNYEVVRDDISRFNANAIVLPANTRLKEGPGASAAIYESAGRKQLTEACGKARKKHGELEIGMAVPTLGFDLPADFIIHAICPAWKDGNHGEYDLLSSAYISSLRLADMMGCKTIAIPVLSSGNNGFDNEVAFEIACKSIESFEPENKLEKVYLIVYNMEMMAITKKHGVSVKENIDEQYILGKRDHYKAFVGKAVLFGKEYAKKFIDDGVELVMEKLNDPEWRKHVIMQGAQIAWHALMGE